MEAEEEKQKIEELMKTMHHGQLVCLVDHKWFKSWEDYCNLEYYFAPPGEIDNSNLKRMLDNEYSHPTKNYDFALLPKEAWDILQSHWGGGPIIERYVYEKFSDLKVLNILFYFFLVEGGDKRLHSHPPPIISSNSWKWG